MGASHGRTSYQGRAGPSVGHDTGVVDHDLESNDMATRPVFVPQIAARTFVREVPVEFTWVPGMAVSQKQKSIESLHQAAQRQLGVTSVLEISSKSQEPLGVQLSAFNLRLNLKDGRRAAVEVAYQASKVFEHGGPFLELMSGTSRDAKGDERLRSSGRLLEFRFEGEGWPLEPPTAFYDWLYLKALEANPTLATQLASHGAFTDIEFNPEKSINCQARSAALYVALGQAGRLEEALGSPESFRQLLAGAGRGLTQGCLF